MIVIKKINNNVAICRDGNQRELVAFGKGIGFPQTPYELTDLSRIDRTFYNVGSQYLPMLNDIPADVVQFVADRLERMQDTLPYDTSANLVLTLADHIAFAMERAKKGVYVQMPSVYEMAMSYPAEIKAGRYLLAEVQQRFGVRLPRGEVQGIAMHLVNARDLPLDEQHTPSRLEQQYEEILEQTTRIIEREMNTRVRRDTFNFARFATHIQFLLGRVMEQTHIDSQNLQLYRSVRDEYREVAACVDRISDYYKNNWSVELAEEEKLYLILHINRVCSKETL